MLMAGIKLANWKRG